MSTDDQHQAHEQLRQLAADLNLPNEITDPAETILDRYVADGRATGRHPASVAAGALSLASTHADVHDADRLALAEAADCCTVSLRSRVHEMEDLAEAAE